MDHVPINDQSAILQLASMWQWDEILIDVPRPSVIDLHPNPEFPGQIRGALGWMMKQHGLDIPPGDVHDRPSAYALLYGDLGHNVARPMQFAVDMDLPNDRMAIRLRLFGWAGMVRHKVSIALTDALAEGVAGVVGPKKPRVRFDMGAATITLTRRSSPPLTAADIRSAHIRLITPGRVRDNGSAVLSPQALISSAVRRVFRMTTWMGLNATSAPDFLRTLRADYARARQRVTCLDFDHKGTAHSSATVLHWLRYSVNQGDVPIPMEGVVGKISFTGDVAELAPWLNIGESCGLGSGAAFGLGRYEFGWG